MTVLDASRAYVRELHQSYDRGYRFHADLTGVTYGGDAVVASAEEIGPAQWVLHAIGRRHEVPVEAVVRLNTAVREALLVEMPLIT